MDKRLFKHAFLYALLLFLAVRIFMSLVLGLGMPLIAEKLLGLPRDSLIYQALMMLTGLVVILIVLLVAIPVGVSMSGAVVAGILGWALTDNGEATHEGSELIELS